MQLEKSNNQTIKQSNNQTLQQFSNSAIQQSSSPAVQRSNHRTIKQSNYQTTQQSIENWEILSRCARKFRFLRKSSEFREIVGQETANFFSQANNSAIQQSSNQPHDNTTTQHVIIQAKKQPKKEKKKRRRKKKRANGRMERWTDLSTDLLMISNESPPATWMDSDKKEKEKKHEKGGIQGLRRKEMWKRTWPKSPVSGLP